MKAVEEVVFNLVVQDSIGGEGSGQENRAEGDGESEGDPDGEAPADGESALRGDVVAMSGLEHVADAANGVDEVGFAVGVEFAA